MLHVTAYCRTKNPRVIVVAGGHAVRALPSFCVQFFDYCCLGDVEEMAEVIRDAFGPGAVAERAEPRFDLADWLGRIGYLEASRGCNFRCSFCTLTAEGGRYHTHDIESVRSQIEALGKRDYLVFLDNNFYGPNRDHLRAVMDLLRERYDAGQFKGWAALVTSDFFFEEENLRLASESGCKALFSGVESFDDAWLRRVNKRQNTRRSPVDLIRSTLDAGIVFAYGLVLDVCHRSVADLREELEFVVGCPDITLPAYVSLSIPILGTPFFHECVRSDLLLPHTRIRDLDGSTLSLRPLDPLDQVEHFIRREKNFADHRWQILRRALGLARRYRSELSRDQLVLMAGLAASVCAPLLASAPGQWRAGRRRRTFVSSTDHLDRVYVPAFPVDRRYEGHFAATRLTDRAGRLTDALAPDLLETRHAS
jgi:hypothetical protein